MRKSIKTLLVLAAGCLTLVAGCDNGSKSTSVTTTSVDTSSSHDITVDKIPSEIILDKTSIHLEVGETAKINYSVTPTDAVGGVIWSSSNTAIAMVNSSGTVAALADGTAVIIATSIMSDSIMAFCTVTVGSGQVISVTSVSLNKSSTVIKIGNTETLIATVLPENATNKSLLWSSSDNSIAYVDANGKVSAVKAGSAKITAKSVDGAKTAECLVTVNSTGPSEDDEEYTIKCNAPTGVTAALSKTKAKKDELITIDLAFDEGFTFKSIKANGATLNIVTEGLKYTFTMGNRPVTIDIEATVSGNVVINGEFNAIFKEETVGSGLFIARNVSVPTAKTRYGFNLLVAGNNIAAIKLDEARCDGDISSGSGSYQFSIGAGATYDFYYDSTSISYPFYALRTKVDYLPTNAQTLETLLLGGRMHSQSTVHPQGLTSIHYEKRSESLKYDYDYKINNDGTAFGHTVDKTVEENVKHYYTWKSVDLENNLYKVMTTWSKALGNNESDDDLWKIDPHNNGTSYGKPYSGIFDIVGTETSDAEFSSRHNIRERDAVRTLNSSAHYGSALEYEIYESYRGDFTGSAVIGAANAAGSFINVTSSEAESGFKTIVNSQLEWNREADSYEDGAHEAIVYSNELVFNTNGSLKSMNYKETYYSQTQWDFTSHKPLSGVTGKDTTIKVSNGYETKTAADLGTFNPNTYFISSIDNISLYNSKTGEDYDSNTSILNYNDLIQLIPYGNGGENSAIVHDFDFSPSTALDGWQYGVTSVEDSSIVGVNHQNVPIVCGIGETDVTFTNASSNDSAHVTKTIKVRGIAKGTVNGFYVNCNIQGYDSYGGEHSEKIIGTAGRTMRYYVDGSNNTGAPIAYSIRFRSKNNDGDYVYSNTSEYCTIEQTGQVLVINCDTEAANALTSPKVLTLQLDSEFYKEGFGPTRFEFTIKPNYGSVVGSSWNIARQGSNDHATISFPSMVADDKGYRVGTVLDYFYNGSTLVATDTFTFKYKLDNNNNLDATVTAVNIESNTLYEDEDDKLPTVYSDYNICFYPINSDGKLGLCLSFFSTSYGEEESSTYGFIYGDGEYDDEGYVDISSYAAATRN